MIPVIVQEIALFLVPFLLYALLLSAQRKRVLDIEHWSKAAFGLLVSGLVLAIAGLLWFGIFNAGQKGEYIPPHIENGKPVQGGFR